MMSHLQFKFMSDLIYDIDAVDGKQYMMNHSLQGCFCIQVPKTLNEDNGEVVIEGIGPVEYICVVTGSGIYKKEVLGLKFNTINLEYDHDYQIIMKNFMTLEDEHIENLSFTIHTLAQSSFDDTHPESNKIALQAARESIVLLKNENDVLPLQKNSRVNLFGKGIHQFRVGTIGAGRITPRFQINLVKGIKEFSSLHVDELLIDFYKNGKDSIPAKDMLEKSKHFSQTAIFVITRGTSENYDNLATKGEFYLSDEEEILVKMLTENFKNTIAIINTGFQIDVSWIERYQVTAAFWCGLGGMFGGQAIAEVLEGVFTPSGRLPDTWSYTYEEIPSSKNFYLPVKNEERLSGFSEDRVNTVYEEGLYVGYKYFTTFHKKTMYPFGYGLSYTEFKNVLVNVEKYTFSKYEDPILKLKIDVRNTGKLPGKEVIQIYAHIEDKQLEQPNLRFVSFAKTRLLQPCENEVIEITLRAKRFASFDESSANWVIEQGKIEIYLGKSAEEVTKITEIDIPNHVKLKQVENILVSPIKINELSKNKASAYSGNEMLTHKDDLTPKKEVKFYKERCPLRSSIGKQKKFNSIISYRDVMADHNQLEDFVCQMSDYELARLSVCAQTGWGMENNGEAGRLYKLEKYEMPDFVFADGNNGVNIKTPNIGLPTSVGVCASFNEKLAYDVGRVVALEAKENGIDVILAPGANLHRNPLGGRNAEYFSEDPILAGRMAGCFGKGLEDNHVLSCVKHFIANNCETARLHNHSLVKERTLRELYLKVFETIFEVYIPSTVMTSYNAINGEYAAMSYDLLKLFLKKELKFEGMIMTDWGSSMVVDPTSIIAAGNCWITPGGMDDREVNEIVKGIETSKIDRQRIERNIYNMLHSLFQFDI